MIGNIPSYYTEIEYSHSLADEQLFQQLTDTAMPATMYSTSTQSNPYPTHSSQYIQTGEQQRPSYHPSQSSGFSSFNNSNGYSDPGSFSAVGAAYGFNPDQPIQISPQNLSSSQNPMVPSFNSMDYTNQSMPPPPQPPHQQFHLQQQQQQQQRFSVPMSYQVPDPDWSARRLVKRHRYEDDSDEEDPQLEAAKRRPQGACVHCKALKVKCEFTQDPQTCNRCRSSRKQCTVTGRKPRRPPPKREDLLNKIREQESMISDLRTKLDKLSISNSTTIGVSQESESSPQEITPNQTKDSNQPIPEDLQIWIQEARVTAHSGAVEDLEPTAVNAGEASENEESGDEDRFDNLPDDVVENGSSALSPSAITDNSVGHSSTTKTPVVGGTLHPIGFIASGAVLMGANADEEKNTGNDQQGVGIAHPGYFRPGMSTDPARRWAVRERQPPPKFFSQGLVTAREVDKLFQIYFERMNLSVSLLDPKIYTAQMTYWRSPFLFTVICAIASRYLIERPDLYPVLMNYARMEAGQALVSGLKSPELVAGYILLSLYPVPSTTWEEDRGWLMLGVAIRMATDLNLHRSFTVKATTEQQRREVANRTRIWINCYNLDRSTSTQFGKPSTIKDDYIASHSEFWYRNTDFYYDIHLCGYTQLLRVMARFHAEMYSDPNQPTGLNKSHEIEAVTKKYEKELLDHWDEWEPRFAEESDNSSLHCKYRIELLRLANAYSRLVILSFRFQNAFQNGLNMGDPFLQNCIDTASSVVQIVVDNMAPHPFLRTAPDAQFVFASFASVFLLKLLRPRFSSVLTPFQIEQIIILVKRLIDVLQSDEVAIDERHTPKLYAKFLTKLLDRQVASQRSARSSAQPSDSSQHSPKSHIGSPPIVPNAAPNHMTNNKNPNASNVNNSNNNSNIGGYESSSSPPSYVDYSGVTGANAGPSSNGADAGALMLPASVMADDLLNGAGANTGVGAQGGSDTFFSNDYTMRMPMNIPPARSDMMMMDFNFNNFGLGGGFGAGSGGMGSSGVGRLNGGDTLASMKALENPAFWDHAMLPGFTWPAVDMPSGDFFQSYQLAA